METGMLPDVSFTACVRIVNDVSEEIGIDPKHLAIRELREALADKIAKTKMEVVRNHFHTEYWINVYVLTPDELMHLVHLESEKMVRYMNMRAGK